MKDFGLKKGKLDAFKNFYATRFVEEDVTELPPERVWCMDATYFGPVHDRTNPNGLALFSVLNWSSRRVLGFILVGGGKLKNPDHVLSCLETCMDETTTWQQRYVHFDQHAAHMSEGLLQFFWREKLCVSLSQGKFQNQRVLRKVFTVNSSQI